MKPHLCLRTYLTQLGANQREAIELEGYVQRSFKEEITDTPHLPLRDEPHIATWSQYIQESLSKGVYKTLQDHLVQLRFPVKAGISKSREYRDATLRGLKKRGGTGLVLESPLELTLSLYQTLAGTIPLLVTGHRPDFINLVRALAYRNEPVPIPPSMGACIVKGYNNWDRIHNYRRDWEEENPHHSDFLWSMEFQRIVPIKELYQDSFIIVTLGDYSGKTCEEMGLSQEEWRRLSSVIRREHEAFHYFTHRLFGSTKNHVYDELLADYSGITKALGYYNRDWFLQFMGFNGSSLSTEGRWKNYLGDPPLSSGASEILKDLVLKASERLEELDHQYEGEKREERIFKVISSLLEMTLVELATEELKKESPL